MVNIHPFTMILFSLILFFMAIVYSHPLYILSILIFTVIGIFLLGEREKLRKNIRYGLYTAVFIIIINPLVYQGGRTVLFSIGRMPIIGKIKITLEACVYGGNMALKLFCMLLIFVFYESCTDRDETFAFFSRYAHKLTLTLSMTTNIIYRLKLEITRVKDVMILRGVDFQEKNLLKRVKAYYPILKVIFISSLEGSLDRAESLYSRGYGKTVRTSYSQLKVKTIDCFFYGISIILMALFIYGMYLQAGFFQFYPVIENLEYKDMMFLIFLDAALFAAILLLWGCRRWKFLKYKI